jgi:hypothetical protein
MNFITLENHDPLLKQSGRQTGGKKGNDGGMAVLAGGQEGTLKLSNRNAADLLFRFLDIVKPLGLRRLERLPGSWGIMLDDLAAGAAVNLALQIGARYLF